MIWAAYSGEEYHTDEYSPTNFFVLSGNYLKTVDIGHKLQRFCFDSENNRIIMNLDSEMQFAYLNIDGLLIEILGMNKNKNE